jgi:hypothetical protein
VVAPSDPDERIADLGLESDVELGGRCERGSALEETHDGAVVLTEARAVGGAPEPQTCRRGQPVVGGQPELLPVATGPLEVVADDLIQLDELARALLEPGREALVEFGASGLR